ncbi:MAG: hypothetical protein H8E46_11155 [FCB group bacterium]|nr:hypothetical protein [FCB group bacterium]
MRFRTVVTISVLAGLSLTGLLLLAKTPQSGSITFQDTAYPLYPEPVDKPPEAVSPFTSDEGVEIVIGFKGEDSYLIPVTVGNWEPFDARYGKYIKGGQLKVDVDDFPAFAETGLHSESELKNIMTITGKTIEEINAHARPGSSSYDGFIASDEDIISVLLGDNELTAKLGLTYPKLAKPLFHLWNILLYDMEVNGLGRFWNKLDCILYNSKKMVMKRGVFFKIIGSKGFQESIFNDEIKGSFQFDIRRDLTAEETAILDAKYSHLKEEQREELTKKLSSIHIGEMVPYYIMRYGFYEGHTDYRADPIAIAFIFGLRSLEEIESAFPGELYERLTKHYTGG